MTKEDITEIAKMVLLSGARVMTKEDFQSIKDNPNLVNEYAVRVANRMEQVYGVCKGEGYSDGEHRNTMGSDTDNENT